MRCNMKNYKKSIKVVFSICLALCILSNCMLIAYSKTESTNSENIQIIGDKLYDILNNSADNEKIPVSIWYKDIDQDNVDIMTKEETGYSIDSLSVNMENDIQSIDNAEQLKDYLSKTANQRKIEKTRTDKYINKRRELSRKQYVKAVDKFLNEVSIADDDIIFKSQYAPMVIANMSVNDIKKISENNLVQSIDYHEEPKYEECTKESIASNTGYNQLVSDFGLTGAGIKVGIVENGYPTVDPELDLTKIHKVGNIGTSGHAANTSKILMGSESGFAKNIDLYSTNTVYSNIEAMLSNGVQLINVSLSWTLTEDNTTESYAEKEQDKWFNHIVSYHNVTVVASAGNDGQGSVDNNGNVYRRVASPAMAHNVIAVGAYDDKNTADKSDDVIYPYSSYKNSNGSVRGLEKPDVVMSANIGGNGTSSSAPVLTAMLALMFELKPSVAAFPQTVKAIVLASCNRKITSYENDNELNSGLTDKQGAGAPDVMLMADILCQGTYGIGTIEGDETEDSMRFVQLPYGASNMNVSLAWLKENTGDCAGILYSKSNVDLDLSLLRDKTIIKTSNNSYSSTELITSALAGSGNYEMKVKKYTKYYDETVRYGYAYCSDTSYSKKVSQEGIYYLKDYQGNYLTFDSNDNSLKLQPFTGELNQKWLFKKYRKELGVYPCSGDSDKGIGIGSALGGTPVNGTVIKDDVMGVSIYGFEESGRQDGKTYFYSRSSGKYFRADGSSLVLVMGSNINNLPKNELWNLEKVGYHLGDVNLDGKINNSDITMLQNFIVHFSTFNNVQKYLADFDEDGSVNVNDITAMQIKFGL